MVLASGGVRGQLSTRGSEADALTNEVRAAMMTLSGLLAHGEDLGESVTTTIRAALRDVQERLDRKELRVVVIGEAQAGKSTFLDALLGERLLGLSKTRPGTVTSIRRAEQYGYRVRFASGAIEVFAARVPDRTTEITKQIEEAHAAGIDAKHRCYVAAADAASASDTVDRAERALNAAFHALEGARDDAARLASEIAKKENEREQLAADAYRKAAALPLVLLRAPPWWALWLWAMRLFLWMLAGRDWRAYGHLIGERDAAGEEIARLHEKASHAAETCTSAEGELSSASRPVEDAREVREAANRQLEQTEALHSELARKAYQLRLDLDRMRGERLRRFATEVRSLSDGASRGKDVVELDIEYPAKFLPDDIVLIDIAGISAGDPSAQEHASRVLQERADVLYDRLGARARRKRSDEDLLGAVS